MHIITLVIMVILIGIIFVYIVHKITTSNLKPISKDYILGLMFIVLIALWILGMKYLPMLLR
jgi:hypothetical protein